MFAWSQTVAWNSKKNDLNFLRHQSNTMRNKAKFMLTDAKAYFHDQNEGVDYDNRSQVRKMEVIKSNKKYSKTSFNQVGSCFFCNIQSLFFRKNCCFYNFLISISHSNNHFSLIAIANKYFSRIWTRGYNKFLATQLFSRVNLMNLQSRSPSPAVNFAHLLLIFNPADNVLKSF